ncbi:MAG: glycosyltransferase family 4 protein, partial [Nitrospirota bacterium]
MKIVIANAQVPFVSGGAENLADDLHVALTSHGHKVELVRIPFKWYPPERIPEHILACRLFDLTESCGHQIDLLIGLKFPAYFIKHSNKVLWVLHQHRPAYDLWGTIFQDIPDSKGGLQIRSTIINADNNFLPEAKKIFTISKNVSNRLKKFNNIDSIPLYPPLHDPEKFICHDSGDYIFYPSRISTLKRQELAVESMKYTKTNVRLLLAGRPDSEYNLQILKKIIEDNKLFDRVKIITDMSDEEKIQLYSNCLGVLFIPYDEDYGYITLEAFYSRKPVITATNSGGPLEFVTNDIDGFVVPPDPKDIAKAMDHLYADKKGSKAMGESGYKRLCELNLSWDNVIETLLSCK